jgi:signal transduction histidine kinase
MRNRKAAPDKDAVSMRGTGRSLIERCPFPICATEGKAHVLREANPRFCLLCGKPRETLLGRSLTEALPEGGGDGSLPALLDRVYRTGEAEVVADLAHSDPERGSVYWSYAVWAVLSEADRPVGLMIQVTDTTSAVALHQDRERAVTEMREMNQALLIASVQQHVLTEEAREAGVSIQESEVQNRQAAVLEERNRIAREIHDTLAQIFTGILLQLQVAQRIGGQRPDEAWSLIEHVRKLAQEGLAETRRSVWALQPEAQEYSDLVGALSRITERMNSEAAIHMELHIHGTPQALPPDVGMNLLRIAQEALTNALRHGQARIVWVEVTFDAERVLLCVQDDGQGFDLKHQADGGGFGLIGMGQRAERLGGLLTIASQPGRGTEVAVSVPLARVQRRKEEI